MPDAGASRKQQFEIKPLRSGDTGALRTFRANGRCPATPFKSILGAACLRRAASKAQESIRCRMPAESISRASRFRRLGTMPGRAGEALCVPTQGSVAISMIYRRLFARGGRPMPVRDPLRPCLQTSSFIH
jgi:hypothetical protein